MERARQKKWDKRNMATCSCRLRKEDYEEFEFLCWCHGLSIHGALRLLVGKLLKNCDCEVSERLKNDVENAENGLL